MIIVSWGSYHDIGFVMFGEHYKPQKLAKQRLQFPKIHKSGYSYLKALLYSFWQYGKIIENDSFGMRQDFLNQAMWFNGHQPSI